MEILKSGFLINNIDNVLASNEIEYLKELTTIFPYVEDNKNQILKGRLSTNNYKDKSEDDTYSYDEMHIVHKYLTENNLHFSQKWCFVNEVELFKAANKDIRYALQMGEQFHNISIRILNNAYPELEIKETDVRSRGGITYYEDNDFIEMHADGVNETRLCVILLYLNENWNDTFGGELVLENENEKQIANVPPKFGDYVILDFTQNNVRHAVNKIKNGFKRFTYAHFVEMKENSESNAWNKFAEIKNVK
jgi:Rps23 Pro-64 3,4-dihydroxylase Tpa1-like proline 4-hydroxylase